MTLRKAAFGLLGLAFLAAHTVYSLQGGNEVSGPNALIKNEVAMTNPVGNSVCEPVTAATIN
jgi:hypothetical protein